VIVNQRRAIGAKIRRNIKGRRKVLNPLLVKSHKKKLLRR